MDDKLNSIFSTARRTALTADEKAMGREMLRSYMAMTPMRTVREAKPAKKAMPFRFALFGRAAGVAGLVTTMLASAAGVSYAAEGSLPGDVLYPVKVGINEELRVAFAATEKDKANVEAERAERRLAEAEALAKKGTLNAETRVALETKFKAHAEKAKSRIEKSEAALDAGGVAEIAAHLEGSLNAHGKIVAALAAEDNDDASDEGDENRKSRRETKQREVAALAVTIKVAASEAAKDRDARTAKAETNERRRSAENRRVAAEKKINEVRFYLIKMRAKLGEEATMEAEQRLIVAEGAVGEGNAKLAAGDVEGAFEAYVRAQRIAQEAKPLIRARGDLKVKVRLDINDDESRDDRRDREQKQEERKSDDEQRRDDENDNDDVRPRSDVKLNVDSALRVRLGN